MVKGKDRNSIRFIKKLPLFTTTNIIEGQAGLIICSSLIFYSLTIDNILNVIVMLILAGVAISVIVDGEGLFSRTRQAAEEYEQAAQNENTQLQSLMDEIDRYLDGNVSTPGDGNDEAEDTTAPEIVFLTSSEITSATFTLTATGADSGSGVAKYEFYVKNVQGEFELEETIEITEGTAIYNVTAKSRNEYKYKAKVYDAKGNSTESEEVTVELTRVANPLGTITFTENKTYDGLTTGTYNNPIIPQGFYPVNENNATWGTVDGYKYGLIISDADLNQYVWVPVDGTNVTFGKQAWYKADGISEYVSTIIETAANCTETLPNNLDIAISNSSINRNGGFYIARFEAGIAEGMSAPSSDTTTTYGGGTHKPVSKQGAIPWNYIQWGTNNDDTTPGNGAVTVARSMYAENNENYGAVSTLIYGAQWDTALEFIQAYNIGEEGYSTYATNSAGYGNYNGENGNGDTFESTTAPTSCGAAPQFRQKNIYDMAGNVGEWTMEAIGSSSRIYRGGSYGSSESDYPAGYRNNSTVTSNNSYFGFRLGLYIKV